MYLSLSSIPHKYRHLYIDNLNNYTIIFNPLSETGVSVLNKEAFHFFSLIDGYRTLNDILNIAKKTDSKLDFNDIKRISHELLISEIIYFNKPVSKNNIFLKKKKKVGVWLHITNQCNLRCTYCYVNKTEEKMSKEIADKALQKLFDSLLKHNIENVTIKYSGGEALLEWPFIKYLVKKVKILNKTYKIAVENVIMTNGILLSKEVCKYIKKENIKVALSLDGLGKYQDRIRIFPNRVGSFIFVKKGIENLIRSGISFNFSITITSKNIEGIPALVMYAMKKNIPFIFNFFRENSYAENDLEIDKNKLITTLTKTFKQIEENISYKNINSISTYKLMDRINLERPHTMACGVGKNYIVIRHDGKLVSCQIDLSRVIGSIDDDDLIETMQKGSFIKPLNLTVERKIPCKDCQWKYICCGGCPISSYETHGTYKSNSEYCDVYKALIPKLLRLEAKRLILMNKYCSMEKPL